MSNKDMKQFTAVEAENGMGWDVDVNGQTWRFASVEAMMEWMDETQGACKVEFQSAE